MSDPSRFHRVEQVFQQAVDRQGPDREAYLGKTCGGDPVLRAEVDELLRLHEGEAALELPSLGPATPLSEGPGSVIGRYRLLQVIGEGGFGVVYMAEQTEPVVRKVALKIIKLGMDTREVIARFEAERQALALMDHPNIAKVLDGGATDTGRPYFVMELVRGVSITEYCDSHQLGTAERLDLFVPVCHAVQHAHQKGVIHRDLKPSNVLVTLHDGEPVPKVIDFGIAKAMNARLTERTLFTRYEQFVGTPAYMSPEQAEMSGLDVDTRTDVYALGVLLYELLTGSTPFDAATLLQRGLAEIQRVIREQDPERPSSRVSTTADASLARQRGVDAHAVNRLLRGDLDWIIMRALEKDRTRRYPTVRDLALDVQRHLRQEPVDAGPPGTVYRMRKFLVRNRVSVGFGGLLLVVLVVGVTGTVVNMLEARDSAREARTQATQALEARAEAERQSERADAARQEQARLLLVAQEEAARAADVTDFLVETLALADPQVALSPDVPVRAVLDQAARNVATRFEDQPRSEARLRATIGRAYASMGEHVVAEVHLRRAIDLVSVLPDTDPAELYDMLWQLTHVCFYLEREDAFAVAKRAQEVGLAHVGETAPRLAELLTAFALAVERGAHVPGSPEIARATTLYPGVLAELEVGLPAGSPLWPIVADTFAAAGYALWYTSHEAASLPFWETCHTIRAAELPPDHPATGDALTQWIGVLVSQGRSAEATLRAREARESLLRVHPPGALPVARTESLLGQALAAEGRFDEAEDLLVRSHQVIAEHLGGEIFFAAEALARVIAMYAAWDREDAAAPFREEMARLCSTGHWCQPWPVARLAFGPAQQELEAALGALHDACDGISYSLREGELDDPAIGALAEHVFALCRELPEDSPRAALVARVLLALSGHLSPTGAADLRRRMALEARGILAAWESSLPLEAALALGALARFAPDGAAALAPAREAFVLARRAESYDHWMLAVTRARIGRGLMRAGLFEEAESLLLPGHTVLEAQLGEQHPETLVARRLVAELYHAWGRPAHARPFEST